MTDHGIQDLLCCQHSPGDFFGPDPALSQFIAHIVHGFADLACVTGKEHRCTILYAYMLISVLYQ
jgi:hypothetical protein